MDWDGTLAGVKRGIGMKRTDMDKEIYALWDELSDFGAQASDKAMGHCMRRLCEWLDADNAFWIGAVRYVSGADARRDPLLGWRIAALEILRPVPAINDPEIRRRHSIQDSYSDDPGETSRALVVRAGEFRIHRLLDGDLVEDIEAFKDTAHYDYFYRRANISDRIWAIFPVNQDTESYVCIDKYGEGRVFDAQDLELVARVLRGIKWFHRQILLGYGLGVGDKALTPAERRVLKELLTGAPEKTIAERLGLKPGTVHQYAVAIFRKFGTRSRADFMAVWLNGSSGKPAKIAVTPTD